MRTVLLDGYNLIYRAWHASRRRPAPHAGVYFFMRSLRVLVEKLNPDKVYFVLEGYPKHRFQLDENYKGTRKGIADDEFHSQKRKIIELMKTSLPVDVIRHADYECDDVIGNMAMTCAKDGECVVVSTDTDFYQLFNQVSNIQVYNPIKKIFVDPVKHDYVKWKALRGDSADNIHGFKGIGDKRALKLILNPSALEKYLDEHPDGYEIYERNQQLIQFKQFTDEEFSEIESYPDFAGWDELKSKFHELQFRSIVSEKPWNTFVKTFECLHGPSI